MNEERTPPRERTAALIDEDRATPLDRRPNIPTVQRGGTPTPTAPPFVPRAPTTGADGMTTAKDAKAAASRAARRVGGMAQETPGKVRRDAPKLWQRVPAAGWVAIGIAAFLVILLVIAG